MTNGPPVAGAQMAVQSVLLCFDENLVTPAKVLLLGLRWNLSGKVVVYCTVSKAVMDEHADALLAFGQANDIEVYLNPQSTLFQGSQPAGRSVLSYEKYLFPTWVPENVDRLLYLDVDIVPMRNIDELFDIEFTEAVAAVAHDDLLRRRAVDNWSMVANGGVILFNTVVYREENLMDQAVSFFLDFQDKERLHEELILNRLVWERWRELGSGFNKSYTATFYTVRPSSRADVRLVHFIGPRKPWVRHVASPFARRYRNAYRTRHDVVAAHERSLVGE